MTTTPHLINIKREPALKRGPVGRAEYRAVCLGCGWAEKADTRLIAEARGNAHAIDPEAHKRRFFRSKRRARQRV